MDAEYLESLKTKKGGWTRETLEKLGVPWPPPKGWKRSLLEGKPMSAIRSGWGKEDMEVAEIIHGPSISHSDTYRLEIRDEGAVKQLDVPGWMVGDIDDAELRVVAARIIRKRLGID